MNEVLSVLAEREGFEPPGLLSRPLSRRMRLSTLPPFRLGTLAGNLRPERAHPIIGFTPARIGVLSCGVCVHTCGWVRTQELYGALFCMQVTKDVGNKFVFDVAVGVHDEAIVAQATALSWARK